MRKLKKWSCLLLALLINGLSSCTPLLQGGLQALVIATYPAEDERCLAERGAGHRYPTG